MEKTTLKERKLPAHLQPWPEHWLPKAEYLSLIAEPIHFYKIVKALAGDAEMNQISAALGRLVKSGEAKRSEKNYYSATGVTQPSAPALSAPATYTPAQIVAALVAAGLDDTAVAAVGRHLRNPAPAPLPEDEPQPTPDPDGPPIDDTDEIPD